jgi:hypothetical protein
MSNGETSLSHFYTFEKTKRELPLKKPGEHFSS